MTTIDPAADVATLINVFTVDPARQRELVDVLVAATEDKIQHCPGFVSANIHASTDGARVVNYAQWTSAARMEEMLADPGCQEHLAAAAALATFEPHLYTVASVHHR